MPRKPKETSVPFDAEAKVKEKREREQREADRIKDAVEKNLARSREKYEFLLDNPNVEDVTSQAALDDLKTRYGVFHEGEYGAHVFAVRGVRDIGIRWCDHRDLFDILDAGEIDNKTFEVQPTNWKELSPGDDVLVSNRKGEVSHQVVAEVVSNTSLRQSYVDMEDGSRADFFDVHHIIFK